MFIFFDTETTGTGTDDRLCQIAFKPEVGPAVHGLFNPGRPISIGAMAVHHITNKMLADKPPFQGSDAYQKISKLADDPHNIFVAHHARFDLGMLNREGIHPQKAICTLKLARYLDTGGAIPKYSLQYLRYYLGLEVDARPHDALGDILVLEAVFKQIYAKFVANGLKDLAYDMIKISNNPVLMARMPYGRHKGLLFTDVPKDYLEWLQTTELDEDMAYTVKDYLNRLSRDQG